MTIRLWLMTDTTFPMPYFNEANWLLSPIYSAKTKRENKGTQSTTEDLREGEHPKANTACWVS